MLSNVFTFGKDVANKLTNKFLNLSDLEVKVKEATNDEPWGPYGSIMKELSDETFSTMNFNEIMTFLWYRIFWEKPVNSRRIYKGLVLLNYLIVHGSEYVAVSCRDHLEDVKRLAARYVDQTEKPDMNVRKKAGDIVKLLSDPEQLSRERQSAREKQSRFYSDAKINATKNLTAQSTTTPIKQSLGSFESWQPPQKSLPFKVGESFVNFVNVFTQNISGPPPTETHDNFEIPQGEVEFSRELNQDSWKQNNHSQQSKQLNATNNGRSSDVHDTKEANTAENQSKTTMSRPNIINEAPIIDFSDPLPAVSEKNQSININQMSWPVSTTNTSNNVAEFGEFMSWNDQVLTNKEIIQSNRITNNVTSNSVLSQQHQQQQHLTNYSDKLFATPAAFTSVTNLNNNNSSSKTNVFNNAISNVDSNNQKVVASNFDPWSSTDTATNTSDQSTYIFESQTLTGLKTNNDKSNTSGTDSKGSFWAGGELSSLGIDLDNLCHGGRGVTVRSKKVGL